MQSIFVNAADHANLSLLALAEPLRGKLQRARVVPSDAVPSDVVTMQSRITVEDEDTGEPMLVSLVYPAEADLALGRLSIVDPLGMELFGARRGEVVSVTRPGNRRRLRITQIVYQPEQSMRVNLVVRDQE